jgi:endonuclease/exonuclease/phosphatase family metal-dependent hydrolase
MRIVTFNIQHGRTPAGRVDVDLVGRVCAGFEADVLGLQEVDVRRPRSGWANTPARVRRATGLHGVFAPAIRGYGNALFSTEPITDVRVVRLPRHGRHEPRVLLLGRTHGLRLGVVHLSIDEAEAREQLAVAEQHRPDVLMGDFNLRGEGEPTWPADNPRIRIDHVVALTGAARVTAAQVLPAPPVSDHRPLQAEVELVSSG